MRKLKGTPGKWSVGNFNSVVVSDEKPPRRYSEDDYAYEKEYAGGYIIAESIPTKADAELLADSVIMLDMIIEMVNEITILMLQFGQHVQVKNFNRITQLLNRSESLISRHTEEINNP